MEGGWNVCVLKLSIVRSRCSNLYRVRSARGVPSMRTTRLGRVMPNPLTFGLFSITNFENPPGADPRSKKSFMSPFPRYPSTTSFILVNILSNWSQIFFCGISKLYCLQQFAKSSETRVSLEYSIFRLGSFWYVGECDRIRNSN